MLRQIVAQKLHTCGELVMMTRRGTMPTMHGSDALKALEIPQLDGHVCRARC